ncbi:MAG: GDSL-type esterase/lipase family protein [Planctomycetota bacterium]
MDRRAETSKGGARRASFVPGLLALLALPLLFLADTSLAWARGWRPPSADLLPGAFVAVFAIALASPLVPLALALSARFRAFLGARSVQLPLAAFALIGGCAASEAITRVKLDEWTRLHRRPANLEVMFRPEAQLFPGVFGDSLYRTSSEGLRGPELPERDQALRILCVGGSTTECVYLDDSESWPTLLMGAMNARDGAPPVWVGGAGISAFSTIEHVPFVERAAIVDEMDCVVFLVGFNDGGRAVVGGMEYGPPPLWRRSSLALLAFELARWRAERRLLDTLDSFGENIQLKRDLRAAAQHSEAPPELERALSEYRDRVRRLVEACHEKGVACLFLTQPVLYRRDLPADAEALLWLGQLEPGVFLGSGPLRDGMDRFNVALAETCRELDVPCVDLSSMNGDPSFFFDDCHFNEAGSRRVAELLLAHLDAEGLPRAF